ncbi:MAG: M23 family metallopeptidase [Clostridiales bacterium]|nr:M23 family metallopeptidase [Clostridiales bacterium]
MEMKRSVYTKTRGLRPVRRRSRINLPIIPGGVRRKTSYRRLDGSDKQQRMAILSVRLAVSAVIVIVVILLKSIDIPASRWAIERVKEAITYDFSISETLGKLKFVSRYLPNFQAVFGEQDMEMQPSSSEGESGKADSGAETQPPVFTAPAEGKVVGLFGEIYEDDGGGSNRGIDIVSQEQGWVYAAADGQVIAIGEDEDYGKYVKVDHGNGWMSFYSGCSDIQAEVGSPIKQGDRIGKMGVNSSGEYQLHFETWKDEQPVDPLPLIQEDSKVIQ